MFSEETVRIISDTARKAGFEPAAILAIAHIESGARAYATVDGRREPIIRFEGHYFDQRLSEQKRQIARGAGLAGAKAGAVLNPRGQVERWHILEKAAEIDRKAAYEATSWGVGQVMGAHWAWLGYASIDAFIEEARAGTAGQLRLMLRYIEKAGLADPLQKRAWGVFARGYNGPGYRKNGYHLKLARAYQRYAAARPEKPALGAMLRQGARGNAVRDLQIILSALGYPLRVDGVFGPATQQAVRAFQRAAGLFADGVVGPKTHLALSHARPIEKGFNTLWLWLRKQFFSLFARLI